MPVITRSVAAAEKRKREAEDDGQGPFAKIQKTVAAIEQGDPKVPQSFLDLPPEVHNVIYKYLAEYTRRFFPRFSREQRAGPVLPHECIWFEKSVGIWKVLVPHRNRPNPIPGLAMTQVSRKIRFDFRPLWLQENRVPLERVESYLSVFHPYTAAARRRMHPRNSALAYSCLGALRVWMRRGHGQHDTRSLMRLLKYKTQHPDHRIFSGLRY